MSAERCVHELLPGQCAACAPPPSDIPARVFRTRGGSAFHRTDTCGGLHDGQRYAAHLGMATHPVEAVSLVEVRHRLAACEVCFPVLPRPRSRPTGVSHREAIPDGGVQVTSSVPSASSPAAAVGSEPAPDPPATVRLRISLDPGSDFEAQRQAVRASGADYDQRTRCWYLWLTGDLTSRAHQLARLFAAADRYGTAIVLEQ